MPQYIDPQIIMNGLSALGSLAGIIGVVDQIYTRRKQGNPVENETQEVEKAGEQGEFANLASNENVQQVQKLIISPEILEAAFNNIKRAEQRFASSINNILNNEQDRDFEKERAKAAANKMLDLIEEFNGGRLPPGDEWQNLAKRFHHRRSP